MNTVVSAVKTSPLRKQEKNPKTLGSRVRSEQSEFFGRLADGTTCSWERSRQRPILRSGVKKRYQCSGDLTVATHQDKDEDRNTTWNYIFLISVTLLSTTEWHFSFIGIIILKAPTSFCNRSHSCIFRHSRDWRSCYFHFWLKHSTGRAHTLTVGDLESQHWSRAQLSVLQHCT